VAERRRCVAHKANGERCKLTALAGADLCVAHLRSASGRRAPALTDDTVRKLAQLVGAGVPVETACATVGIGRQTYYRWWELGDPAEHDVALQQFRDFRSRLELARAEGQAALVVLVRNEANRDAAQARWLLERGWPEQWARPSQRDDAQEQAEVPVIDKSDPFAEIDELARRRGTRPS
jgi:hypothetical protein